MAQFVGKLGDLYATRESTIEAMLRACGQDTSQFNFTPSGGSAGADLHDNADVRIAWAALVEVYGEVSSQFLPMQTSQWKVSPIGTSPNKTYTIQPYDPLNAWDSTYWDTVNPTNIVSVRVLTQPPGMKLVYRGGATGGILFDLISSSQTGTLFDNAPEITIEITHFVKWEHIPYAVRRYIYVRAGRLFAQRAYGLTDILGLQQQDEERAEAQMREAQLNAARPNFLGGSASAVEMLDRWPY